jgi:hypothetical protein
LIDRFGVRGGSGELRSDDCPRDVNRIGEDLSPDERRRNIANAPGMPAIDASTRVRRFKCAFLKQDRAAGAVRQDQGDRIPGAPSDRFARQNSPCASNRMAAGFG